ncbi:hypothetical protein KNT64_gp042 [Pseudomonas phage PspYZU05]|uniref:Uncharacterized protein n=1 Tax=Pseudomonas phage PspYZU05 TaxID=1983556 RepID=A0A2U7NJG0_9CAUD|nr:hypothetical protein KNT64_gp042 [Pseudomonas phage PspYZU05]ASD51994.1 hypothetical protein PspYZU05_42 [Pseudomonas phage PspYZU05]
MTNLNVTFKTLSIAQVLEIGAIKKETGKSNSVIGLEYGVSSDTIAKALKYCVAHEAHVAKEAELAKIEEERLAELAKLETKVEVLPETKPEVTEAKPEVQVTSEKKQRIHKPTKKSVEVFNTSSSKEQFINELISQGFKEGYAKVQYGLCVKFQ